MERAHGRAARTLERTCREIDLGIQRAIEAFGREVKKSSSRGIGASLNGASLNGGAKEVADGSAS